MAACDQVEALMPQVEEYFCTMGTSGLNCYLGFRGLRFSILLFSLIFVGGLGSRHETLSVWNLLAGHDVRWARQRHHCEAIPEIRVIVPLSLGLFITSYMEILLHFSCKIMLEQSNKMFSILAQ